MTKDRNGWWTGGLVLVLVIPVISGCAGGKEAHMLATPEPVSNWHGVKNVSQAGRFTFAGQPNEAALEQFAQAGGQLVIDIRTHEGKDGPDFPEQARAESLGLEYRHLPVTPASLSRADVDKFSQAVEQMQGPILFHCASSNRVGALWAAYLALKKGVPTEQAIADGRAAGMVSPEAEAAARRVIGP